MVSATCAQSEKDSDDYNHVKSNFAAEAEVHVDDQSPLKNPARNQLNTIRNSHDKSCTSCGLAETVFTRFSVWYQGRCRCGCMMIVSLTLALGVAAIYWLFASSVKYRTNIVAGSIVARGSIVFGTSSPSAAPSTSIPSAAPSSAPSSSPSVSQRPSFEPSTIPSLWPTTSPSSTPTTLPSVLPSVSLFPSSSPSLMPSSSPSELPPPIFYVMGDVPYDRDQHKKLDRDISRIPDDADFVVHLGDMNRAAYTNCTRNTYAGVQRSLKQAKYPVFIIPGDNDIFDCPSASRAVRHWRDHFLRFENRWKHDFDVDRQKARPENFAFFHKRVLFLGLYIVAGGGGKAEVEEREKDCLDWTFRGIEEHEKQRMDGIVIFAHKEPPANFFKDLGRKLIDLDIPVLYIHGNGHTWQYRRGTHGVRNLIRVQVDKGGDAAPLGVSFWRNKDKENFVFNRRK